MIARFWSAVLVAGWVASARAATAQAVPLALRARVVSEAVIARRSELADSVSVDACGVWRGLGRTRSYLELLDPQIRALVKGDVGDCTARPAGALWILDGVRRAGPASIGVTATYLVPFSRERAETYVLTRGRDGRWRVTEIRLGRSIEKATQPLIPNRAPPGTTPHD